jgi:4-hydroxy 2-oxovalerate aldolase
MNIKILDCTLRDGGHLNHWKFPLQCGKSSYFAAIKSGVDFFEVGYRFPNSTKNLGDFGYCTDEFIKNNFPLVDKCKLTIMIDAGKGDIGMVPDYSPNLTPVRAIRIAAYPYQYDIAFQLIENYKQKGYEVFLNLMAASEINKEQMDQLKSWKNKDLLNAVYFADSFGSFLPKDIPEYYEKLKSLGFRTIGYHAHNNLQLAFANTLKAIEIGIEYIDASIYGMGRGGGNLPIEVLLGYLEKSGNKKYNTVAYLDVIERFYLSYFKELDWGYNLKSYLSGIKNIHPYYVDELMKRKGYTIEEQWDIFTMVANKCPISFSVEKMNEALGNRFYIPLPPEKSRKLCEDIIDQFKIIPSTDAERKKTSNLLNIHKNRNFVVITNGPSISKYRQEISEFIKRENAITIGVNFLNNLFVPDFHMFMSKKRFMKYANTVNKKSKLLIPWFFGDSIIREFYSDRYEFFDIETTDSEEIEPVTDSTQKVLYLNVGISAILMAYQMGASNIFAVGMDGYLNESNPELVYFYNEDDTPDRKEIASVRYDHMAKELNRVNHYLQDKGIPFTIITPTSHKKFYRNLL